MTTLERVECFVNVSPYTEAVGLYEITISFSLMPNSTGHNNLETSNQKRGFLKNWKQTNGWMDGWMNETMVIIKKNTYYGMKKIHLDQDDT
jgi:hypothetical protein